MRPILPLSALALALLAGSAMARTNVSVDVSVGVPIVGSHVAVLPAAGVWVGHGPRRYWYSGGYWYRPWGPRYVVVAPPVGYAVPVVPVVPAEPVRPADPPPVNVPATKPDPIIYPRNGQDATQTEADRQECNRWATTQPQAVADASVFSRAVEACMDGRGYSMK